MVGLQLQTAIEPVQRLQRQGIGGCRRRGPGLRQACLQVGAQIQSERAECRVDPRLGPEADLHGPAEVALLAGHLEVMQLQGALTERQAGGASQGLGRGKRHADHRAEPREAVRGDP